MTSLAKRKRTDDKLNPTSQYWVRLEKVYHGIDTKQISYMVELQYIFKTKKQAIRMLNKIDKHLTEDLN